MFLYRWASQARVISQLPEASESVENAGAALSNFLKRKRASVANQTEEQKRNFKGVLDSNLGISMLLLLLKGPTL